jgi:uncharacterized protein YndB with AHSA1/START domain
MNNIFYLQPYWWNESETSTPARAMMLADCLFNMATRGLAAKDSATADAATGGAESIESGNAESTDEVVEAVEVVETKGVVATISDAESGKVTTVDRETLVQMFATRDKHLVSYSKYHEESRLSSALDESAEGSVAIETADREAALGSVGHRMLKVQNKPEDLWLRSAHFLKREAEPNYTNWTEIFYG